MSRGVLDQEAYDASVRADKAASAKGMKAVMTSIYYRPDGKRVFTFRFDPIKRPRGRPVVEAGPRPAVASRRGALAAEPPPAQGELI
jgi:hypothetical protein